MSTPGMWFKVEMYAFIPEGGELKTDDAAKLAAANGLGHLGFSHIDDLRVSVLRPAVKPRCPSCDRERGDEATPECYLC